MTSTAPDPWNHNSHYDRWIRRRLPRPPARVLDVGCGDGRLLARLAAAGYDVVGLEPDPATARAAGARLAGVATARVEPVTLAEYTAAEPFHAVLFVASLHHMRLRQSLVAARELLAPGGTLLVVGLAANRTPVDYAAAAVQVPASLLGSLQHRGRRGEPAVPLSEPRDSVGEITAVAHSVLPGAWVRRGLYHRYLLSWRKPFLIGQGPTNPGTPSR